jgi:hypothetical protein
VCERERNFSLLFDSAGFFSFFAGKLFIGTGAVENARSQACCSPHRIYGFIAAVFDSGKHASSTCQ